MLRWTLMRRGMAPVAAISLFLLCLTTAVMAVSVGLWVLVIELTSR